MNPTERLTPHFTLGELTKSSVRLPNVPLPLHVDRLRAVCEFILEPVREAFGLPVMVSSGYRSPAVNARVRGSDRSQHVKGEAVDFEVMGVPNAKLFRYVIENLPFDQVILEFCGWLDRDDAWHDDETGNLGWVHCSYTSERAPRGSIKVAKQVRKPNGATGTQYETLTREEALARFAE